MSSGCGDVLSLEDLKTAKKHQTFEAEVITGHAGGVASGAEIDFATNQVTGQSQKTLPAILRDMGFDPASFDFTTGGTVNARDTVVYNPADNNWYSWAGALPHVVGAGTDPTADGNWKPRTDQLLRQNLAAIDGLKLIGRCPNVPFLRNIEPTFDTQIIDVVSYGTIDALNPYVLDTGGKFQADFTDSTTADDGWLCLVTGGGKRWKRVIKDTIINLSWAGVKPGDNIYTAWSSAINYVDNYVRNHGFEGRPVIGINAGSYVLSSAVSMPSWVSTVAYGNVEIDATGIASGSIISITNTVAGVDTTHHKGFNISSIGGTIFILGPAQSATSPDGIFVGNTSTGKSQCRNVKVCNVAIENTNNAVRFGSQDTYMTSFQDCHFEYNYINVSSPNSTSSNSGETMKFFNVILSHAIDSHVYNNTPGMDMNFVLCNFDMTNGDVIKLGDSASFFGIKLVIPHIEQWDGFLLGGPTSALSNVVVMIEKPVLLPRARASQAGTVVNSSSRKLTNTATQFLINGLDMRHEKPAYTEDVFMSDYSNLYVSDYLKDAFRQIPSRSYIMNRGWDIGEETEGAAVTGTMVRLSVISRVNMSGVVTARSDGGGKQLTMTSTDLSGGLTLQGEKMEVQPGNSFYVISSIQPLSATGSLRATSQIQWLDSAGNVISTSTSTFADNLRTTFDDSTLPNYADGTSRYISARSTRLIAPPGAVSAYPRVQFNQFLGTFNISRLVCAKVL